MRSRYRPWLLSAQDGQGGVWQSAADKNAFAEQQRAAQAQAALGAEAAMQAKIDAIVGDAGLTAQQKYGRLMALTASGYSWREHEMLQDARASILQ